MSHTILYNRLFVRLPDETYIALVQSGDNNVTTVNMRTGREVRSREWTQWTFGRKGPSYTEQEILTHLRNRFLEVVEEARNHLRFHPEDWNGGDEEDEAKRRFGYYACLAVNGRSCQTTTFGMYRNFFVKGLREAVTLEEFAKRCGGFRIFRDDDSLSRSDILGTAPATTLEEIKARWNEATRGGKSAWIIPASEGAAERMSGYHKR